MTSGTEARRLKLIRPQKQKQKQKRAEGGGGQGGGAGITEVSKSGQLSVRRATANNSFPPLKSDIRYVPYGAETRARASRYHAHQGDRTVNINVPVNFSGRFAAGTPPAGRVSGVYFLAATVPQRGLTGD